VGSVKPFPGEEGTLGQRALDVAAATFGRLRKIF
jgi:hypothetical protein